MYRIVRFLMTCIAGALTFYDPPSNRDDGNWREDCSCVGDISSWQDGN